MSAWHWIGAQVVHAVHNRQLAQHGGLSGIRDAGAVESALARPQNLTAYGKPDACDLAAAYAWGLARSHGFSDGNKRSAWVTARLFLADNGCRLRFNPADAVKIVEAVAGGTLAEDNLANWFRERLTD